MISAFQGFAPTLSDLENKWVAILSGDRCPPVLGLAPLTDHESDLIGRLVVLYPYRGSGRLLTLLDQFPATTVVWLSRKAGEAYEAGAFWDKFSELLSIPIPMYHRPELASSFRQACRRVMATWVPPTDLGGHNYVAEFLFQAGLPLDRCDRFAQHFRKVERNYGLPDPDFPDVGEQLRESVLDTLEATPFLTLKRALRGPAGPRICEVALGVVLNEEFADINPRLGHELARAFEKGSGHTLRRSIHQPFLRVGGDWGSLEIVGPRQEANVFLDRVTWILNGRRNPTPRNEDFVDDVTTQSRVTLELSDRAGRSLAPQTFVLKLDDRAVPFMLFDERTRKERRVSNILQAGCYWILHRPQDRITGASERYDWADGERVLSRVEIRPGRYATLEAGERIYEFAASVSPFFESSGEVLQTSNGEQIEFGWKSFPSVWMPIDYIADDMIQRWRVNIYGTGEDIELLIVRTAEEVQGMARCSLHSDGIFDALAPGLYRLRFNLHRLGSRRAECSAEFLYWKGLQRYGGRGFELSELPFNLITAECRGFVVQPKVINHQTDHRRRHTLTFDLAGSAIALDWSQPGLFLETVERRPGEVSQIREHRLGDVFPATAESTIWLRLWVAGWNGWELWIDDKLWQRSAPNDRRTALDLSLANLAVSVPEGGELKFRADQMDRVIARFTSPLHPFSVAAIDDNLSHTLAFHFPKPVAGIRGSAWNLSTGRKIPLERVLEDESGHTYLSGGSLPAISFTSEMNESEEHGARGSTLTISAPKLGWPGGVWILDFETRRRVDAEWEPLRVRGKQHAPMSISVAMAEPTLRSLLLSASRASGTGVPDLPIEEESFGQVVEVIADLTELQRRDLADTVAQSFSWVKDSLRSISTIAGHLMEATGSETLRAALLNLACQDSAHTGFVFLPGLLALSSAYFQELPVDDPLNEALRHCAIVSTSDSLASLAKLGFFDMHFSACFANFFQVASMTEDEVGLDLTGFSYEAFWAHEVTATSRTGVGFDWSRQGALGHEHLVWAIGELRQRYQNLGAQIKIGAANTLLHEAAPLRAWLESRLAHTEILPSPSWKNPWPRVSAADADFIEAVPRFASLFALAARCSSAEMLPFEELREWLEARVGRKTTEYGISALVTIAPELFGQQLLFWEVMIRTLLNSRLQ